MCHWGCADCRRSCGTVVVATGLDVFLGIIYIPGRMRRVCSVASPRFFSELDSIPFLCEDTIRCLVTLDISAGQRNIPQLYTLLRVHQISSRHPFSSNQEPQGRRTRRGGVRHQAGCDHRNPTEVAPDAGKAGESVSPAIVALPVPRPPSRLSLTDPSCFPPTNHPLPTCSLPHPIPFPPSATTRFPLPVRPHPIPFSPPAPYTLLFNLGDETALYVRGGFCWKGRPAFLLKDSIDRRFMRTMQKAERRV